MVRWVLMLGMVIASAGLHGAAARAQDSGLLFVQGQKAPLTLQNSSFMYQPLPPEAMSRELRLHDHITVLVDYRTSMQSEGEAESRKTASYNAVLAEWIGFDGRDIFRGTQSRGDPAIQGSLNSQYRAEGDIELSDSLTFRIAAEVTEIFPNGNLVIEAHRNIEVNDETWRTSLTGTVARQAIGPDRTVRSDSIVGLRIQKKEQGQVRNAYAPGWLGWWWSRSRTF